MPLSHFRISKAAPKDRPYKLSDGFGLSLLIEPNGAKKWRFRYHLAGREKMIAFGTYPATSLAVRACDAIKRAPCSKRGLILRLNARRTKPPRHSPRAIHSGLSWLKCLPTSKRVTRPVQP
jgi:hypothetical protein